MYSSKYKFQFILRKYKNVNSPLKLINIYIFWIIFSPRHAHVNLINVLDKRHRSTNFWPEIMTAERLRFSALIADPFMIVLNCKHKFNEGRYVSYNSFMQLFVCNYLSCQFWPVGLSLKSYCNQLTSFCVCFEHQRPTWFKWEHRRWFKLLIIFLVPTSLSHLLPKKKIQLFLYEEDKSLSTSRVCCSHQSRTKAAPCVR